MATYASLKYAFGAQLTGEIPTAAIADDAVTLAKMAGGTDGNLIGFDASGDPAAIATGTAGQVLTSGGADVASAMADAAGGGKMIQHTRYIATNAYAQGTNSAWAGFDNFTTISATSSTNKFYAIGTWPSVRWCGNTSGGTEPSFFYGVASTTDGGNGNANGGWSGTTTDAGGSGNNICRTSGQVSARLESTNCANDHLGGNFVTSAMWTTGQTSAVGIGRINRVSAGAQYTSYNNWGGVQAGTIHMFELEP